jgi:aspartate/methionine/tyrosine aminotransferase
MPVDNLIKNKGIPRNISKLRLFNEKATQSTINLGIGLPEVDIPNEVKKLIPQIVDKYKMDYSTNAGDINLRKKIAEQYNFKYESLVITHGAQEALMCVLVGCLNPNTEDQVLIPDPGFLAYPTMINILQNKTKTYQLNKDGDNFYYDPEEILKQIDSNTKIVLINTPSNPCGNLISDENLLSLAINLKNKNVLLVCDEVYGELIYEGDYKPNFLLHENIVTINSFSKSHAMTGFRLGWIGCQNDILLNQFLISHQYLTTCATRFSQSLMLEVFEQNIYESIIINFRKSYQNKLNRVWNQLSPIIKEQSTKPIAGFYLFLKVPKAYQTSEEFCLDLLEKEDVLVVPGQYFGKNANKYYRLSFSSDISKLEIAVNKINKFYS